MKVFVTATFAAFLLWSTPSKSQSSDGPHMSDQEAKSLYDQVRSKWRAQDGETADEIFAQVAKVAHFSPRGWNADYGITPDETNAYFLWTKRQSDAADEVIGVDWHLLPDGNPVLQSPYARTMELGWRAFALSLIQSEVDEDVTDANKAFLHDPNNLNFITTAQGNVGDLLLKGKCAIEEPLKIEYTNTWGREEKRSGDFWFAQINVNCNIAGPTYFTRSGLILFFKDGLKAWRPFSFFANRIATALPGSWFKAADPIEAQAFKMVRDAVTKNGMKADDVGNLMKVMELRNDGSMIHW